MKGLRIHSVAAACLAVICLVALFALTADRSSAFTLIERQFAFDPFEITVDQSAHIVVNNTFGAQTIHITINFADAITGNTIGSPFESDLAPGHGAVALLPAVQLPPVNTVGGTRALIGLLKVGAAPGVGAVPFVISNQITGSLDVVDMNTGHVSLSRGFGITPGVGNQ